MAEIKPDYVWPKVKGDGTKKPGPWIPVQQYCGYKTSYEYGFPRVTAPEFFVEPSKHLKCDRPQELERDVLLTNYITTYNKAHDWKYVVIDPLDKNEMTAFRKFNFLKEFDEKCRTRLPRQRFRNTEYKDKYPQYDEPDLSGVLLDQKKRLFCPLKGLTRDDVSKIDVSEYGHGKYLDIYLSQSHLDYKFHKPKITDQYKNSEVFVKPAFPPKPKELFLLNKGNENIKMTFNYTNPLQISCSETMSSYQVPKPMVDPIVDCLIPKIKQTIGDVCATPGMYHTEYSHMGHNCRRKPLPLKQLRYLDHLEKIRTVK